MRFRVAGGEKVRITSGGNVGIGTDDPGTQLHLYGSTPILRLTDTDTSGPIHTNIDGASGYLTLDVGSVHRDVIITSANQANEIARFEGDGNVGIGTDNPSTKVHIYDASADPYLKIGGSGRDCGIQLDAATNFTAFRTDAANRLYVNAGGDSIRFSIGGTGSEKLRITSTGIIGINNTGPEGKGIDVAHSRTNGYSATGDTRNLAHIIARNSSDGAGRFAAISLVNGGGTQAEGSINLVQTGNYAGDLTFKLRTGVSAWSEIIRVQSTGVSGTVKNNFLLNEFRRGDTSSQHGALSTSWSTDTTISDTISNYQRGQRIIIRATVPCGIALSNSNAGTNYGGTIVRIKVTGNTSGGTTYSNNRPVWYRADGAGTHETTINLFICVYINESDTTFSNGETLTVNIQGQKNGGGAGSSTHYLGGWSSVKEITIERYIKEL
tara:strand:- start:53 stop:1366 length:1314 start_codon:yes stop_codon:yes gene_type:complete